MISWKHKILLKFRFWLINDKLSSTRKSFRVFDDTFPKRFQRKKLSLNLYIETKEKSILFQIPNSENEFSCFNLPNKASIGFPAVSKYQLRPFWNQLPHWLIKNQLRSNPGFRTGISNQFFRQTNLQKLAWDAGISWDVLFCQGSGPNVIHSVQNSKNRKPYLRTR